MFLPLNMATLGPIPRHDISAASGFFNLTRQLGGSIGVATLSTLLTNRIAFHGAVVSEHLVANDPAVIERLNLLTHTFAAQGMAAPDAHAAALKAMYGSVQQQASVMAFGDTFWIVAVCVVAMIPLIFLLGKPPAGAKLGAGAH